MKDLILLLPGNGKLCKVWSPENVHRLKILKAVKIAERIFLGGLLKEETSQFNTNPRFSDMTA